MEARATAQSPAGGVRTSGGIVAHHAHIRADARSSQSVDQAVQSAVANVGGGRLFVCLFDIQAEERVRHEQHRRDHSVRLVHLVEVKLAAAHRTASL